MKQQRQRNLTVPLSRARKTKKVPVAAVFLGITGLFGIAGLLYFVSLQSQAKRTGPAVRRSSVDEAVQQHRQQQEVAEVAENGEPDVKEEAYSDADEETNDAPGTTTTSPPKTVVLSTKLGRIRIQLRPDLSLESTQYLTELAQAETCSRCNFYRAEKPGILQGILDHPDATTAVVKGQCPPEYVGENQPACPTWDPECGCHGPTMTRGMVGWAGGATGPDFFVDMYAQPARFWGQQHTVFGQITEDASLDLVDRILELPVTNKGMRLLNEKVHFTIDLE